MAARHVYLALALLVAGDTAACECPAAATSRNRILTVLHAGSEGGLVVCGDKESVENGVVTASNFEVFRCGARQPVIYFDAIRTARLESRRGQLRILEIAKWPFGKDWQWIDVAVLEWWLHPGDATPPPPRLVAARPAVTSAQVATFLAEYEILLTVGRGADEEIVGRLFTAAMSGDKKAARLFRTMREDGHLDGAAGETHSYAEEAFEAKWGRVRRQKQ